MNIDVGVIILYTFHEFILFNDVLLVLMNGTLWIPQIIKSFKERSRFGPDPYFIVVLSISHIFYPLYVRGCPANLFDRAPSYITSIILILVMAL
jgi:hypothetical protein